ncbi:MAG: alpha/beta hydrolase [Burkholderiaceae bacterium]
MKSSTVLLLPGWKNSGLDHWQSRWEATLGHVRVEQHDWERPLRGDWLMQLEQAVLRNSAITLVAHSLGCHLVAAWAAHSRNVHRVRAALLVAPSDVEREEVRPCLPSWSPIERQKLPFQSILVASHNDPFCSFRRSQQWARDWGAELADLGMMGHLNAQSGLGDWPQGQALLERLQ